MTTEYTAKLANPEAIVNRIITAYQTDSGMVMGIRYVEIPILRRLMIQAIEEYCHELVNAVAELPQTNADDWGGYEMKSIQQYRTEVLALLGREKGDPNE